jgi:hypothetical protein
MLLGVVGKFKNILPRSSSKGMSIFADFWKRGQQIVTMKNLGKSWYIS